MPMKQTRFPWVTYIFHLRFWDATCGMRRWNVEGGSTKKHRAPWSWNELWMCACEIHVFVQILGPKFGLLHVSHWVVQNLMLLFKYQTIVFYTCNAAQVLHWASNPKNETWMTGGQQQSQANSGNFNQTVSTGVSLMYSSVDATVSIRQSQCLMQRDQLLSLALRDDSLARLTLGSRRCHILGDLPVIGNVYRPETLGKKSKKSCRNGERCDPTESNRYVWIEHTNVKVNALGTSCTFESEAGSFRIANLFVLVFQFGMKFRHSNHFKSFKPRHQ